MNEKMSKRRIQITDLQKQEIEEKEETNKLIRLQNEALIDIFFSNVSSNVF